MCLEQSTQAWSTYGEPRPQRKMTFSLRSHQLSTLARWGNIILKLLVRDNLETPKTMQAITIPDSTPLLLMTLHTLGIGQKEIKLIVTRRYLP